MWEHAGHKQTWAALALASLWTLGGCSSTTEQGFSMLHGVGGGTTSGDGGATTTTSTSSSSTSSTTTSPGKGPPYPIVLAHGFFGADEYAGLDFADYFYGVKEHLTAYGEWQVYTPAVDPFNHSDYRGAQLADAIGDILADTGYAKVNIIGHSQGGLDARVVAHDHPEMVAAVITVATPHQGTPIADIALKVVDHPMLSDVLDMLLQTVGQPVWDEIGEETSLAKPMYDFSTEGIAQFNAAYPDQPGVFFASVTGRSDHHDGGSECKAATPPFIEQWEDTTDPIDVLLSATEMVLDGGIGDPHANDGMLRAKDAQWGQWLGCIPADHFDEVGQMLGDKPGLFNDWSHLEFYASLIGFLRDKGL